MRPKLRCGNQFGLVLGNRAQARLRERFLKKAGTSRDDLVNGLAVVNLQAFASGNFEFP